MNFVGGGLVEGDGGDWGAEELVDVLTAGALPRGSYLGVSTAGMVAPVSRAMPGVMSVSTPTAGSMAMVLPA